VTLKKIIIPLLYCKGFFLTHMFMSKIAIIISYLLLSHQISLFCANWLNAFIEEIEFIKLNLFLQTSNLQVCFFLFPWYPPTTTSKVLSLSLPKTSPPSFLCIPESVYLSIIYLSFYISSIFLSSSIFPSIYLLSNLCIVYFYFKEINSLS
jgi:hypothetical protein